ncbi:hypothetical protein Taro_038353 [Colocasia esculenta]|uniref:Glutamine amidotransferase domain-containing protein n=1 Tax=Colocasia esculenta TaxID=4460 RepID=A0A843W6G4_COLES|nr:hypothetical protein [Colocasia esculenta]
MHWISLLIFGFDPNPLDPEHVDNGRIEKGGQKSRPFTAGRYHSLVIENETFPSDALEITAWTEDGLIMAARHRTHTHIQKRYNDFAKWP